MEAAVCLTCTVTNLSAHVVTITLESNVKQGKVSSLLNQIVNIVECFCTRVHQSGLS